MAGRYHCGHGKYKPFSPTQGYMDRAVKSGNDLEAGLLSTQTMTLLCVSLSKKDPRAFSLNATFRLEELLSW